MLPLLQPQALIDQLAKYKRSVEEVDLREKQLAAMRVDIFSSDALKKLKGILFFLQLYSLTWSDRKDGL